MPAVADIQNTIVKEFAGDSRVVTAVMSQDEEKATLEEFWLNVYLRGSMIYDPDGSVALGAYGQPSVALPASRWFIIDHEQRVVIPQYGYDPDRAIDTIHALLDAMGGSGDFDGDGDVDTNDFDEFDLCFTGAGAGVPPGCEEGDLDGDADIDCDDWYDFIAAWTAPGSPPTFDECPVALAITMDSTDLSWMPISGAIAYDVMQGDLDVLRNGDFAASVGGCLQGGVVGTSVDHGAPPATATGGWFLVRAVTTSGAATYESLAPSQVDRRDAGISASGIDCP